MTKAKFLLGAGASALALGGLTFTINSADKRAEGAPFLHPLQIARSLCGEQTDGLANRRAFFVSAAKAYAATGAKGGDGEMLLQPGLDAISYDVTTAKPEAQAWFDQGLAYMFNFNHAAAVKAFKKAQAIDPECAMCLWGEALSHGPNINAPMFDEAVAPAWAALRKAMNLRQKASQKEQALINALGYRYQSAPLVDRSKLDNAYADAMDDVAKAYPDDDLILSLSAEANMDTQAWDYWTDGGRTPKGRTAKTLSLLETVLARNPDYAAAIHLYIHTTEASRNPYRAADFADRLANLTPGLGHLIHMPSHTYYRIGRFEQSLEHNIVAVAADEAYLNSADASVLYEYGYFTHNIHFAMTSAQMAGDGSTALLMAEKLDGKLPLDMASAAPWVQPIKAAPYFAMVQFGAPEDILSREDPGDALPFLQAAWRYARGEALAKLGDADASRAEAEAISALLDHEAIAALNAGGVPAQDILNIMRLTVFARAAASEGDFGTAIEAMEEAVALQDAIPYTEPPFWYYPAKQTLAAMALQAGQSERAEQLFLEALTLSPNNAWVLYGLAQTYEARGDKKARKYAHALFKDTWLGDKKTWPSIENL